MRRPPRPPRTPTARAAESNKSIPRARSCGVETGLENESAKQERLAKLSGGVALINVGAAIEMEMKEKKARVEDAPHATRTAVEEGIVPGGGVALIPAINAIKNTIQGANHDQDVGSLNSIRIHPAGFGYNETLFLSLIRIPQTIYKSYD